MDNPSRMFSQIAAEDGITESRAKLALYLFGLAKDGRSLADAAHGLRRKQDTIKRIARDFMIDFHDYHPFARERDKGEDVEARHSLRLR